MGWGIEPSEHTRRAMLDQTVGVFASRSWQDHTGRLDLATNSEPRLVVCFLCFAL